MNAISLSGEASTPVHRQFEAALPAIRAAARYAFRRWRPKDREEAIAEAQAAAWCAWHGLLSRGHDPVAVGVWGIARNAVRHVRNGRRVSHVHRGRGAMDILHPCVQKRRGIQVVSLDRLTGPQSEAQHDAWRAWLAADNRFTPADEAAFRLDFAAWLARLPLRKRRMAELLAAGHGTGAVAQVLRVTPGAVSQARGWLKASWWAFQEPATGATATGLPGPGVVETRDRS